VTGHGDEREFAAPRRCGRARGARFAERVPLSARSSTSYLAALISRICARVRLARPVQSAWEPFMLEQSADPVSVAGAIDATDGRDWPIRLYAVYGFYDRG